MWFLKGWGGKCDVRTRKIWGEVISGGGETSIGVRLMGLNYDTAKHRREKSLKRVGEMDY